MQTPIRFYRRTFPMLIMVVLLLAGLSGCAKQRANMALKKATKRVEAARAHNAERYNSDMLTQASEQVESARNSLSGGSYDQALTQSQAALESATRLLDKTLADRAMTLQKEAMEHVQVARRNKADQSNPELFAEAQESSARSQELLTDGKYEKSIQVSLEVADKVSLLLRPLRERAQQELREANSKLDTLIRQEEGREEAPKQVSSIEQKIEELDQLISDEQRQYLDGHQVYLEILALVEEGTTVARRSRSQKWIEVLENKLTRAIEEEAEIYRPELLQSVESQFREIVQNFEAKNYQQVLDQADMLEPTIDRLILDSQIEAATDRMEQVREQIRELRQAGIEKYLPGRLEKLEEILSEAEDEFNSDLYNDCKKTCEIAFEEYAALKDDFDREAEREINEAAGRLDQADNFLERMQDIFNRPSPRSGNALEDTFEDTKESLLTQLQTVTRNAEIILAKASVEREDGQYGDAIESARTVARRASRVVHDVYKVVSHNNIMELAKAISEIADDGGEDYAAQRLAETRALLARARAESVEITQQEQTQAEAQGVPLSDLDLDPNAYRKVVATTSEVRAELEAVYQEVRSTVASKIREARAALELAEENKAADYTLGDLTTARQVLTQASDSLAAWDHMQAASQADQARDLALEAAVASARQWAEEEISSAREEIQKTDIANVEGEAVRLFDKAQREQDSALSAYTQAENLTEEQIAALTFRKSRDMAALAANDARAARMAPVTAANQAVSTAKQYGAWDYDYPLLVEAIVYAKSALDAMEADDFFVAKRQAQRAEQLAIRAAEHAKNSRYEERVTRVEDGLRDLKGEGGAYYAPEAIETLFKRLIALRNDYTLDEYDEISEDLDILENDLFSVASALPNVFDDMLEHQRELYQNLIEQGARDFANLKLRKAEQYLRWAEYDWANEEYRRSYVNLRNGAAVLASVDLRFAEYSFANEVRDLLSEFEADRDLISGLLALEGWNFKTVFGMDTVPDRAVTDAMLMGADPGQFRESMVYLYTRSQGLTYPVTMGSLYEQVVEMFRLARDSSVAFEKLSILGHYDEKTAGSIVDQAYDLMNQAMTLEKDLTAQLEYEGLQFPLVTRRSAAMQ